MKRNGSNWISQWKWTSGLGRIAVSEEARTEGKGLTRPANTTGTFATKGVCRRTANSVSTSVHHGKVVAYARVETAHVPIPAIVLVKWKSGERPGVISRHTASVYDIIILQLFAPSSCLLFVDGVGLVPVVARHYAKRDLCICEHGDAADCRSTLSDHILRGEAGRRTT